MEKKILIFNFEVKGKLKIHLVCDTKTKTNDKEPIRLKQHYTYLLFLYFGTLV